MEKCRIFKGQAPENGLFCIFQAIGKSKKKKVKVKETDLGVPIMDQGFTNLTSIHENMGLIPAQWIKDLVLP